MPSKYYKRNFLPNYYYHIYNRGVNKIKVFRDSEDYNNFLDILAYYLQFPNGIPLSIKIASKVPNLGTETTNLTKSSFQLVAYCLIPNHFHFVIKQISKPSSHNNVTNFMRRLTITYAMYSKDKYDRSGALFEGKYKNVFVNKDTQLIYLTKYVHRNPLEIQGSEPLEKYKYSSYQYYLKKKPLPTWLDTKEVMSIFSNSNPASNYKKFVEESPIDIENFSRILLD